MTRESLLIPVEFRTNSEEPEVPFPYFLGNKRRGHRVGTATPTHPSSACPGDEERKGGGERCWWRGGVEEEDVRSARERRSLSYKLFCNKGGLGGGRAGGTILRFSRI